MGTRFNIGDGALPEAYTDRLDADPNDDLLAEEFRRLRLVSAHQTRCNSLGFLFGE